MNIRQVVLCLLVLLVYQGTSVGQPGKAQLERWLKRFPEADADGDGRLTIEEAEAHRRTLLQARGRSGEGQRGAPQDFEVDPGWQSDRFPDHAVCHRSPPEVAAIYAQVLGRSGDPVTSYPTPTDGSLRIVGTGHSFMAPGYQAFPRIAKAAGLKQPPLLTHTGGGITGSARYKWEQENGIFGFDGKPTHRLLASLANAPWDAMMWGPYYHDRPAFYACWIEFGLKYNPQMKFYLSDAWPQLGQLDELPTSEAELTDELFAKLGQQKRQIYTELVGELNQKYPGKVFVMPTCDAMVLAVQYYHRGELPGVQGIHSAVGKNDRSLWRDQLGHLGPGFGNLEGYVFYATLYGRSPARIEGDVDFGGTPGYPSRELDRVFRKIAWQAVVSHPLSGVADKDGDGIRD